MNNRTVKPAAATRGMRAISIRQPYVEQILRGTKKREYRSQPTNIRGRVYLYASLGKGPESEFKKLKIEPGELPIGLIVGTVEDADCVWDGRGHCFAYVLKDPKRLARKLTPTQHPRSVWWYSLEQLGILGASITVGNHRESEEPAPCK
jgi:hypothetical protein